LDGLRADWNDDEKQLFQFVGSGSLVHFQTIFFQFPPRPQLLCMELPFTPEEFTQHLTELMRKEGHREDCYIRPLAYFDDEIIGVRLHDVHPAVSIVAIPFGRMEPMRTACTSLFLHGDVWTTTSFPLGARSPARM
jgi:branched-chain amino acid aminotransferase